MSNYFPSEVGGERVLGRRTGQVSIADVDGWYEKIPKRSVWYQLRQWSVSHLRDEAFEAWYAERGRPSIPPSYMLTLLLLQVRMGWSDREAVEAAYFDDRAKFALGVSRIPEITCEHSTLCKYRARFLREAMGRQLLSETLHEAADAGLLGNDEDLVDSFMIAGAAARQGTLVLIYRAIGMVLAEAAEAGVAVPNLSRHDYGQRKKPAITWRDPVARQALLEDLVADGRKLGAHFRQAEVPDSLWQAVELLRLVVEQDITTDPDGRVTIAQRTAKDRVISTVDPQMRHGRKSSSEKFDGYKGHVMVQNTDSEGAHLVTAALATPGNVADGDMLAELVAQRRALTGEAPAQVMGDSAYGNMQVRDQVAAVSPTTVVEAPVPPATVSGGRYPKTAFTINAEAHTITCPAEYTVTYAPKRFVPGHKQTQEVRFPTAVCRVCPLAPNCVGKSRQGRTVTIRPDEARIQAERARQASPQWQSHYRLRSRVEHRNLRLTRNGARRAKGLGTVRATLQVQMAAAIHNIEELGRVLGGLWPPGTFRPQCPQTAV